MPDPARYHTEWVICEDTGRHACHGACPVHGGDGCLIVVAWTDRSHVRKKLAAVQARLWLARKALEDVIRSSEDERLRGISQATLDFMDDGPLVDPDDKYIAVEALLSDEAVEAACAAGHANAHRDAVTRMLRAAVAAAEGSS